VLPEPAGSGDGCFCSCCLATLPPFAIPHPHLSPMSSWWASQSRRRGGKLQRRHPQPWYSVQHKVQTHGRAAAHGGGAGAFAAALHCMWFLISAAGIALVVHGAGGCRRPRLTSRSTFIRKGSAKRLRAMELESLYADMFLRGLIMEGIRVQHHFVP
jgi:hypothetical protein